MVAVATLLALVILRVALLTIGSLLLVRPVRDCPACFRPTAPILHRWLQRLTRLQLRWCPACGWRGLARPSEAGPGGLHSRAGPP